MEDHDFEKIDPFDQLISTQSLQIPEAADSIYPSGKPTLSSCIHKIFGTAAHHRFFSNAFTAMSTHRILKRKHSLLFISFRKSDLIFLHSLEKHLTCS